MNSKYEEVELLFEEAEVKDAVEVKNLVKSYGYGKRKTTILPGISLTIEKGTMYGLIGPSGCGKTTFLKVLVGRHLADSGSVKIFGNFVGSKESRIPGDGVGYMPQETSLFGEFTIKENMIYYGLIYSLSKSEIKQRTEFLLNLLHLPDENSVIKNLSGGQQRRVSFAVSLFQNAPLLILDEPTVGVDPLLRQSIWKYLLKLTIEDGVTVILTTHYIDEVRQANMVGLMRDGCILAQDTPTNLLSKYQFTNLEDVFLKICSIAEQKLQSNGCVDENKVTSNDFESTLVNNIQSDSPSLRNSKKHHRTLNRIKIKHFKDSRCINFGRTQAVTYKNIKFLWRNILFLIFQFIVPTLQLALFCSSLGYKPKDLNVGLINHDTGYLQFGKIFIQSFSNQTFTLIKYDDLDVALEAVKKNQVWAVFYIPKNFSSNLLNRFLHTTSAANEELEGAKVKVWFDTVDKFILLSLRLETLTVIKKFLDTALKSYGINPSIADLPVSFETNDFSYDEEDTLDLMIYMAPGALVLVAYFVALALTNLAFVLEKKDGLLERIYVAGVTDAELVCGFCVSQGIILMVQLSVSMFVLIQIYDVPCDGSIILAYLLLSIVGWTGLFHGLLFSAIFDNEYYAAFFHTIHLFPSIILTGALWPVESLPTFIKKLSYFLPQTYSISTYRAILLRGWSITEWFVIKGFLIASLWLIIFIVSTIVVMRLRK